jgi:hypothetical protein
MKGPIELIDLWCTAPGHNNRRHTLPDGSAFSTLSTGLIIPYHLEEMLFPQQGHADDLGSRRQAGR